MRAKSAGLLIGMVLGVIGFPLRASAQSDSDQAQADAAYARLIQLRADLVSGTASLDPSSDVETSLRLAKQTQNPRLQELFRREFDDQFAHTSFDVAGRTFAQGLSKRALDVLDVRLF